MEMARVVPVLGADMEALVLDLLTESPSESPRYLEFRVGVEGGGRRIELGLGSRLV